MLKIKKIHSKYYTYDNVVVFEFNQLNETPDNTLEDIVALVYENTRELLPDNIHMSMKDGLTRAQKLNKRYEEIKHHNFDYIDRFYHIHGSHRGRH